MPITRHKIIITAAVGSFLILFLLVLLLATRRFSGRDFHLEPVSLSESSQILNTPYCGFYHLYGYTLSETGTADAADWCQNMLANDSGSILLLQINLCNYSDQTISSGALEQLDAVLSSFSGADRQIILRFVYDWDGKALQTEPSHRSQIQAHMEQTAPVVNRYASHVFLIQGVFTGNCGEMNQTHYGDADDIITLMTTLSDVISPEIFLSVRTPQHLRTITGDGMPLSREQAYDGTLPSRLGLYNDGMLGDAFDCGTYDDTPRTGSDDPTEKGTREEELAFQDRLCRYVPNGGEAVLDNPYNDLPAALSDLSRMHVSYLSCDHDAAVLDKWKSSIYEGSDGDVFHGVSGYDYIAAHLGYRFVVRGLEMNLSQGILPTATLGISVENTGFSPAYRAFEMMLLLRDRSSGEEVSVPVSFDTRTLMPGETSQMTVWLPSVSKGNYDLILSMTDPATKLAVPFANTGTDDAGQLLCGQLTVS